MELIFQFTEGEGTGVVVTEKVRVDITDNDLKVLVINGVVGNLGRRSMLPFKVDGKEVYLAVVATDDNQILFTNAENM